MVKSKQLYKNVNIYDSLYKSFDTDINYLKNYLRGDVLELGCGSGRLFKDLSVQCNLEGIDNSSEMLDICKSKFENKVYLYDILNDTHSLGKQYDFIVMSINFIHHFNIESLSKIMKFTYNHLKENGIVIVDSFDKETYLKNFKEYFRINEKVFQKSSIDKDWTTIKYTNGEADYQFKLRLYDSKVLGNEFEKYFHIVRVHDEYGDNVKDRNIFHLVKKGI